MSAVLAGTTFDIDAIRRDNGIVRFGLDIISDEEGNLSYCLCVQRARHYVVKFKRDGGEHRLVSGFTKCDRGKCVEGKIFETSDAKLLCAVGVYKRLGKDEVLVVGQGADYKTFQGDQIVDPFTLRNGTLLSNGQSIQRERRLKRPIDLGPGRLIYLKVIHSITDTITNVDGKAVITNNEAVLRAEEERWYQEFNAAREKQKADRQACGKEFAREVALFLKRECGFTHDQVSRLFKLAGPGQCHEVVDVVRWAKAVRKPVREYYRDTDKWKPPYIIEKVFCGAEYVVSIGGIPKERR